MTSRGEVYSAIDGERAYQAERWNCNTSSCCGKHSVTEFLVYIKDYVDEALHIATRVADPEASQKELDIVRKIAALGVACMEQHGAPVRKAS